MADDTSTAAPKDEMWASHTERVHAAQPRIRELIEEVTGWNGCGKLADHVVALIIANQGRSGDEEVRPPCWQNHAPTPVPEYAERFSEIFHLPVNDPLIKNRVEAHRQSLIERFGLNTP